MRLVPATPGAESGGHSYCFDFGKSLYDKALILLDFLLIKTMQEIETSHCCTSRQRKFWNQEGKVYHYFCVEYWWIDSSIHFFIFDMAPWNERKFAFTSADIGIFIQFKAMETYFMGEIGAPPHFLETGCLTVCVWAPRRRRRWFTSWKVFAPPTENSWTRPWQLDFQHALITVQEPLRARSI